MSLNPLRRPVSPAPPAPDALGLLHRRLPGYAPTALRPLPELAQRWGVARVLAKTETARFGLPSFKPLGATWAVHLTLLERAGLPLTTPYDPATRAQVAQARGLRTLVTATDGNHGRAVAWTARLFGLAADVVVPAGTAAARCAAIAGEGARVHVSTGDYDTACAEAAQRAAEAAGALLVQDTWLPGHGQTAARIVDGYRTLFLEIDLLLPAEHVDALLVPVGVGSLALAAVRHSAAGDARLVAVEPDDADCVRRSLLAGEPVTVPGPHRTHMAGLSCGTPNAAAWPELAARLDAAVSVEDPAAEAAMRDLAAAGIAAGATGAASVAGAAALLGNREARAALGLTGDSTVLVLVTEGVTDPEHQRAVVPAGPPGGAAAS